MQNKTKNTDSDVIIHPPYDSSSVLVTVLHTPEQQVVITKACSDQLIILFICENVSHCTKDILNNETVIIQRVGMMKNVL